VRGYKIVAASLMVKIIITGDAVGRHLLLLGQVVLKPITTYRTPDGRRPVAGYVVTLLFAC